MNPCPKTFQLSAGELPSERPLPPVGNIYQETVLCTLRARHYPSNAPILARLPLPARHHGPFRRHAGTWWKRPVPQSRWQVVDARGAGIVGTVTDS